jgi:tetratricopeptide (TPR) repeat protein
MENEIEVPTRRVVEKFIDRTITRLTENMAENPEDAGLYCARGLAYLTRSRSIAWNTAGNEAMFNDFNKAITLGMKTAEVYFGRGFASRYSEKHQGEEAKKDFSSAIALDPTIAEYYYLRACTERNNDDAIADYSRTLELVPDFPGVYEERASLYFDKGDNDNAIADYTRAIALDPDNIYLYRRRLDIYWKKGDWDHVLADLTRIIALDPCYVDYLNRARVYECLGDLQKAFADVKEAIERDNRIPGRTDIEVLKLYKKIKQRSLDRWIRRSKPFIVDLDADRIGDLTLH